MHFSPEPDQSEVLSLLTVRALKLGKRLIRDELVLYVADMEATAKTLHKMCQSVMVGERTPDEITMLGQVLADLDKAIGDASTALLKDDDLEACRLALRDALSIAQGLYGMVTIDFA